jgi:hypothetical protein
MKITGTASHPRKSIIGIEANIKIYLGLLSENPNFLNFRFKSGSVETISHEINMMIAYRNHLLTIIN